MELLVPGTNVNVRRFAQLPAGPPCRGHRSRRAPSRSPAAFTLLELLIAITIIAILAGLLLTVAGSVNIAAHNTQVSVDIQNLAKSIAAFKQRFGVEPPSKITLYEYGSGHGPNVAPFSSSNPADDWGDADPQVSRSMGLIRQIWPQFDFTIDRDINGDGDTTDTFTISGAECLVFFLGGVPGATVVPPASTSVPGQPPVGFSLNPADPFNRSGSNRERFHEFDASRLLIFDKTANKTMNTYRDPLGNQTMPYLYFSSYGGQGYDISEVVGSPANLSNAPGGTFVDFYRQGSPGYWSSTSPFTQSSSTPAATWNPNTYQIISPGADQQYGTGGEYEAGDPKQLLTGARGVEHDNVTNFSTGPLAP